MANKRKYMVSISLLTEAEDSDAARAKLAEWLATYPEAEMPVIRRVDILNPRGRSD